MKIWARGIYWIGLIVGVAVAVGGCVGVGVGVDIPGRARVGIAQEELVRRTQELVDSVAGGDKRPWQKYLAEDCMYFDERGTNMDKVALVKSMEGLPVGYSGSIKIARSQSRILEDVAILSYDLEETETVFGQVERARYHSTDTWVRRNGEWQIVAGQVLRYYEDPAPGKVEATKYKEYVGTYEIAPGETITVSMNEQNLYMRRENRSRGELIPEAIDIFFTRGVEGRQLFWRAADGKVDALIQRRNNEDVVWKKVR
jgi:uncharacterized protein DUF4440/uncharacterized protein DUF3471